MTKRCILHVKPHGSITQNNLKIVSLQMVATLTLTLYRINVAILPVTMATERQRRTNKQQIWKGAWLYRRLMSLLHLILSRYCYYGNYFFSIGRVLLVMWHMAAAEALPRLVQHRTIQITGPRLRKILSQIGGMRTSHGYDNKIKRNMSKY